MMVRFYSCFFFLTFSASVYVGSYTLADSENNLLNDDIWERDEHRGTAQLDLNEKYGNDLSNFQNENQIPKTKAEGNAGRRKWFNVLTFDRFMNLTEKDKGPDNDTKVVFIKSEDHLKIYENDDDDDDDDYEETGIQERDVPNFSLLRPEGFLSRIHSSEEKSLERTKRQTEGGTKKCRCRRKGRRKVVRRRRRRRRRGRRRRVGQTRPARRRRRGRRRGGGRRRRGKRRCVCRKKDGGEEEAGGEGEEGNGDEEPEVEEADGDEETTTTGGGEEEENDNEEGGDEEYEAEGYGDDEYYMDMDEYPGSDEESDEQKEGSEEGGHEELDKKTEFETGNAHRETPVYMIPYPGTSGTYVAAPNTAGAPMYTTLPIPFSPYPYYTRSQPTV